MRTFRSTAVLLLAIAGCSRSISIVLPAHSLTVLVYSQGKVAQRCAIVPGSEKFKSLSQLMQQNAAGWHSRSANYVPSIVVIGPDVNLYFMDDSMVVNYSGGEYSRTISADAYKFLECKST
ncbi:MAG: hypothetical protein WDM77_07670 [Steroidobacteraceae bacterium]